jgi:uncharacterized protein (DUF1501 family)
MKRRQFLRNSAAISAPVFFRGMPLRAYGKSSLFNTFNTDSDRILVLVQCLGGNDGLNTVLPLDQYSNLFKARSNILIPENQALPVMDGVGFHPSMGGMRSLYDGGKLGIVQGVGYPNQNRSHFRSTDIWTTGSPADEFWTTGWLGRYFDGRFSEYPNGYPNTEYPDPFAITVGSIVSETCQGTAANFSLAIQDPFSLSPLAEGEGSETPDNFYGDELSFVRTSIIQTNAYTSSITAATEKGNNLSTKYPDGIRLAQQLKTVAYLIAGGLRTQVYVVSIGGFDTHANQAISGNPVQGAHAGLLGQLSDSIEAFQDDLKLLGVEHKVMGMVFTEFGRRIKSNNSMGTDHGSAGPMFLFGSCLNAGILGNNPVIPDEVDNRDGVGMQFDFRSVYGTVLEDWFDVEQQEIRDFLLPSYEKLPLISPCGTSPPVTHINFKQVIPGSAVYPNPAHDKIRIQFHTPGGQVEIAIFDMAGKRQAQVINSRFSRGDHTVEHDVRSLPTGSYVVKVWGADEVLTQKFIRQ